jgi:acyl carrier protein
MTATAMDIRSLILKQLATVTNQYAPVAFPASVDEDFRFEELWLDSVAFVALISQLEAELGLMPAPLLQGTFQIETVGDFIALYDAALREGSTP